MKDALMTSDSENSELHREKIGLKTEINRLQKENGRLDILLDYYMEKERVTVAMCEQRNGVLMHYNELQSRSAEVEAMAMTFEQRAAGAVENPTSEMATPRSRKKDKKDNLSTAMELQTASS
jgi:hypothetical protein